MFSLVFTVCVCLLTLTTHTIVTTPCLCIQEVGREMAAFVPILWCKIREGKQSSSVVKRETQTNALHEAHEQTDHDSLPQQQVFVTTL